MISRKFLSRFYTLTSSIVDKQNVFLSISNDTLERHPDNEDDVLNEIFNQVQDMHYEYQSKCVDFALFYLNEHKDQPVRSRDMCYRLHACLFMVTHNFLGGKLFSSQ